MRLELLRAEVTRLALDGVGGNPGGQDNLALVVTTTDREPAG